MERRHYLFAYDISDDRQRTQVFETLRDHGDHAQYSVFFCELSARELADLCGQLEPMINHATDQIMLLDLGTSDNPLGSRPAVHRPTVRSADESVRGVALRAVQWRERDGARSKLLDNVDL